MTRYIVDVNLLFALLYDRHEHSEQGQRWLARITAPGSVGICRVVEMGVLRLLTRAAVMGANVISPAAFWRGWEVALSDDRLIRLAEPPRLEACWRALCEALTPGSVADTVVYIAAFALAGDLTVATFDRGFARFPHVETEIIPAD